MTDHPPTHEAGDVDFLRLLDSMEDVVSEFDREGRHKFVSVSIEQIAGRPRSDFIGRTNRELGMDPAMCDDIEKAIKAVFTSGTPSKFRFTFAAPDGDRRFESTLTPRYDEIGRTVAVAVVARDITALHRATSALAENEERLRYALAAARAGVWDWNIVTGEATWSLENYALFGVDPAHEVIRYADWQQCLHPEDVPAATAAIKAAVDRTAPEFRCEYRVMHPSLGMRWLLSVGKVHFKDNIAVRMSGINLDITERKKSEAALLESDHNKDVFIATLAHELRNYLTPITNRLYMIKRLQPKSAAVETQMDAMGKALAKCNPSSRTCWMLDAFVLVSFASRRPSWICGR